MYIINEIKDESFPLTNVSLTRVFNLIYVFHTKQLKESPFYVYKMMVRLSYEKILQKANTIQRRKQD